MEIGSQVTEDFKIDYFISYLVDNSIIVCSEKGGKPEVRVFGASTAIKLYRLDVKKLGYDKDLELPAGFETYPAKRKYGYMTMSEFTMHFVKWAACNPKVTAITIKQLSSIFNISQSKAQKILNQLLNAGILMKEFFPEDGNVAKDINADMVKWYVDYFEEYERCRFCKRYNASSTEPFARCLITRRVVDGNRFAGHGDCQYFRIQMGNINEYNEFEGITSPL